MNIVAISCSVASLALAVVLGASPTALQAQTAKVLASDATRYSNPNESCNVAVSNNEAAKCTVKNVCVKNESGAILQVWISAFGRAWTGDAPSVDIPVGQETCRGIYAFAQGGMNQGIGILSVKAKDAQLNWKPVNLPTRTDNSQWGAIDYGTATAPTKDGKPYFQPFGNWPAGGNSYSRPLAIPNNNLNDSNWKLTIYGRVLPSFNMCGQNNPNESSLVGVKPCVWTTTP